MAPTGFTQLRPRQSLSKETLPHVFKQLKSQSYNDPSSTSRGLPSSSQHSLRSIAWNPLGSLVATGSADRTLRVWNPEKPNVRFSTQLASHSAGIEKVAFNPVKDAELASLSNDGTLKIWDVRTKACVNEVRGLGDANALAWAPDGTSLLAGNRSGELFRLSPTQPAVISTHKQPVATTQVAFCWSGEKVFVATRDGRIRILTYPELEPVFHVNHATENGESTEFMLKAHTAACLSVELSPTGKYLATGGADSIVALFDTKDWLCQRTITRIPGPVRSISFTWDGSYVVGGSEDGSGLEVVQADTGEYIHTIKTAGPCEAVAWAPTRYWLAYSDLGILRIIGVDTERK